MSDLTIKMVWLIEVDPISQPRFLLEENYRSAEWAEERVIREKKRMEASTTMQNWGIRAIAFRRVEGQR
jgi:hypothetical protein